MMVPLAIGLAVLGAACFALAAVLQHRAAGHAFAGSTEPAATRRLTPRRLLRTVRNPWWVLGLVLTGVGATLHAVGLALAPVSVIQPVGVLAVPFAVLLSSRWERTRPSPRIVAAVLLCLVGVAAFVALAAGSVETTRPTGGRLLSAGLIIGGIVIIFALLGARGPHWLRSLGWAGAGAVLYGFVSTLLRSIFVLLRQGVPRTDPVLIGAGVGVLVSFGCGLWLLQQALASGRPEVVTGTQTVVDPAVAVLAGMVLLGEGAQLSAQAAVGLVLAAAVALLGVFRLARDQFTPDHPTPDHPASDQPHPPQLRMSGATRVRSEAPVLPERRLRHEDHARQ